VTDPIILDYQVIAFGYAAGSTKPDLLGLQ